MTLQTFFDNFAMLADSPNGVAKLRELILQLAIRASLVPQDPNDEPGSLLFEKIIAERASQSDRESKKKPQKRSILNQIDDSEIPLAFPPSWHLCRLGDVATVVRGVSYNKSEASDQFLEGYVPLLRAHNINMRLNFEKLVYVPASLINERQYIREGDVLIAMSSGSAALVGKAAQADEDIHAGFGAFCGLIRPTRLIFKGFINRFFQSPYYRQNVAGFGKGIGINNLQKGHVENLVLPLPPLEQQKRIAAKVDELMRLCDELETRERERRVSRVLLNNSTLAPLNNAASLSPEEFDQATVRLADNFSTLYDSAGNVTKLRSTILQLAVQGKLVPQDRTDEAASILLKQIERKNSAPRSTRNGEFDISERGSRPFEIPKTWVWINLGVLLQSLRYGTSRPCSYLKEGSPVLRIPNVVGGEVSLDDLKFAVLQETELDQLRLEENDLLMVRSNGSRSLVGRTAVVRASVRGYAFAGYLVRLRPFGVVDSDYLHLACESNLIRKQIEQPIRTTSGVKNINSAEISRLLFPLPPLAEQKRIVNKVNQLMTLCNELETKLRQAEADGEELMSTAVQHVLNSFNQRKLQPVDGVSA